MSARGDLTVLGHVGDDDAPEIRRIRATDVDLVNLTIRFGPLPGGEWLDTRPSILLSFSPEGFKEFAKSVGAFMAINMSEPT